MQAIRIETIRITRTKSENKLKKLIIVKTSWWILNKLANLIIKELKNLKWKFGFKKTCKFIAITKRRNTTNKKIIAKTKWHFHKRAIILINCDTQRKTFKVSKGFRRLHTKTAEIRRRKRFIRRHYNKQNKIIRRV